MSYVGVNMPLTIECVVTRLYGLGFSYTIDKFWLNFNIPNGCIAQIDPSASFMDDQMVVWGTDEDNITFEPYTYTSDNCDGYTITYEAQQILSNGAKLPLPSEVLFYPDTRTFYIQKCVVGGMYYDSDSDCTDESILPYTKQYDIVIIATLQTDLQTFTNEDNVFRVTITPDCTADMLSLQTDWNAFPYYISKTNPMVIDITPAIDQEIVTCYKECSLVEWGWNSYPNPPVTFFDPMTGQIKIETDDYAFDGMALQLKLTCFSPFSIQPQADASDIDYFEIDMMSECRDATISKPQPSQTSISPSLWTSYTIDYTLSTTSNSDCGNIFYSI